MGGSCQRTWDHAIPKTRADVGGRISVQYRPRGVSLDPPAPRGAGAPPFLETWRKSGGRGPGPDRGHRYGTAGRRPGRGGLGNRARTRVGVAVRHRSACAVAGAATADTPGTLEVSSAAAPRGAGPARVRPSEMVDGRTRADRSYGTGRLQPRSVSSE